MSGTYVYDGNNNERLGVITYDDLGVYSSLVAFNMAFTHSLTTGQGTLDSFTRALSDTPTVTDFEDLVKDVTVDEARFVGARRVENLIPNINDSQWVDTADLTSVQVDGHTRHMTVTNSGGIGAFVITSFFPVSTKEIRARVEVKVISGLANLTNFGIYTGDAAAFTDVKASLTEGEWVTVCSDIDTPTLSGNAGIIHLHTGDVVYEIRKFQYEDVTGQANQNPSEYVSVGVGTETPLVTGDNSTFDSSLGDWINGNAARGTVALDTGKIKLTNIGAGGGYARATLQLPLEANKLYAVGADVSGNANSYAIAVSNSPTGDPNEDTTFVTSAQRLTSYIRPSTSAYVYLDIFINKATDAVYAWFDNITCREVDHGSNVDGVKYFNTLNYNTVNSNVVSSVTLPPEPAGVGLVDDPTFTYSDTSANGEGQWYWSNTLGSPAFYIDGSKLSCAGNGIGSTSFAPLNSTQGGRQPQEGEYFRVQYTVAWTDTPIIFGIFDIDLIPKGAGTHDFIVRVPTSLSAGLVFVLGALEVLDGATLDDVQITPLSSIPDDYLKGVLIEEGSTNLFQESVDFETTWVPTRLTSNAKSTTIRSPMGWATELICDAVANSHSLQYPQITGLVADSLFCVSVYAKAGTKEWLAIETSSPNNLSDVSYFDLVNGVVGATNTHTYRGMEYIGDGWYRCWVVHQLAGGDTTTHAARACFIYSAEADNDAVFAGNGSDVQTYIDGAQFENLPYPTSYIPTAGASADRGAEDLFYETPKHFVNSGDISYSVALGFNLPYDAIQAATDRFLFMISDVGASDVFSSFFDDTNGRFKGQIKHAGAATYPQFTTAIEANIPRKTALNYDKDANNVTMYVDGSLVDTDPVTNPPDFGAASVFSIGTTNGNLHSNATIKGMKVYAKSLTQTKLEELTT